MIDALVVLAGGRSTRFGDREKAVAKVAGAPMIVRVIDRLASAVGRTVVNCRRDQRPVIADALGSRPVRFAIDPVADAGPVAGMATGLEAAADAGATRALVVGCDMPGLDAATACALAARLDGGDSDHNDSGGGHRDANDATGGGGSDADAVVPVADGRRQPLGAVYRVAPAVEACAAVRDDGPLTAVLDRLRTVEAAVPAEPFVSVDTPEAVAAAARRLGERTGQ
ncbi:molybdenum cofactor guanylyltransferase [Halobaculum roseum]|uniref:Molybdenum cofactor guanylyltransferase n=1 Tax=Halobaculum roseum TaxID=2175149 RepID=A0ABD5MUZ4_9EURY|nr:molybdenum cofactor guanylyltransferase [Halobaculum roseum]QZY02165.1 molybdenum cofactor guanylyltransferase [Halobaculum roseum]